MSIDDKQTQSFLNIYYNIFNIMRLIKHINYGTYQLTSYSEIQSLNLYIRIPYLTLKINNISTLKTREKIRSVLINKP